ncbi:MAG TPA: cyclodeaminase/cyclohydrolase family protein [Thermoplasmata archaeon]|nr:cyclodeaminase/cyclohydrolase family protein [Thermoplasmata archaeon]
MSAFTDRLAARTPTPGGGSAAAAAGALAAALGEMVLAYSIDPAKPDEELRTVRDLLTDGRRRLLALVEEDAASYEAVRTARRARKERPGDAAAQAAYLAALRNAAAVPLGSARLAQDLAVRLESVRAHTKAALASDLVTSLALFRAATEGALANVAINLDDLRAAGEPTTEVEAELERLRAPR